jgi:ferredoxin-NADP reductase/phenylpropionate dioxygenase-like ring-hydroxylating dioxygenase large terminal subunit
MNQPSENLAGLVAGLERGETLPAHWYTDPSITEREINQIFRKSWNYIGPLKQLTNVGDYITGYVGGIPAVVIRNESGLTALINVCRHRRHEVMKGCGNAKMMQCGYHAWTYDLTGCLKGAPRTATEPNFRLEDYPLLPLKVDTLGPWVFVNADLNAPPVQTQFGKILEIIAGSGIDLDTLVLYERSEWESYSNWKTMLENYLECYHCAIAHPGFSAAIDVLPENYNLGVHGWFMSQVGHVRQSALEGKSQVKIYDASGEVAQAQYHLLWPNMTININPGFPNLSIDVWIPNGPNGTKGFSEQYFGPGVSEDFAKELIGFNVQVGLEDDVLTDSVQRGLRAAIPDRSRFLTRAELLVGHFQKLNASAVAGDATALKSVADGVSEVSETISVTPTSSAASESERSAYVELELFKVEPESELITSFYFRRLDGQTLQPWEPGQFLPIRVTIPGQKELALRTYTLSTAPNADHYRLSIRREGGTALVSPFLHAVAKPGFRLEAAAPRGKFVLNRSNDRTPVFISGGVGVTPMIAMVEYLVEDGRRTGKLRPAYFIHGAHNHKVHAFSKHIRDLANEHSGLKVHIAYSHADPNAGTDGKCDSEGRISIETLKQILPFGDYDFYLCGPTPFMKSLYDGLTEIGVREDRIHYESFGPATVLKPETKHPVTVEPGHLDLPPVRVRFSKSGATAEWSRDKGTLLELAESIGLAPKFGCRSGICGTCITRISNGAVDYLEEPVAARGHGEVLLCCSIPRYEQAPAASGGEREVVLDL